MVHEISQRHQEAGLTMKLNCEPNYSGPWIHVSQIAKTLDAAERQKSLIQAEREIKRVLLMRYAS